MVIGLWTEFLLSLACASAIAWLAALVKTQPKSGRILIGAAFASAWIVAGAKPDGTRSGDGARHGDVKPRGECSGDGAPAVAGDSLPRVFAK